MIRLLLLRLGGVAVGALGLGLTGLAAWNYTRGPQYGAGGTVFLLGIGAIWLGLQMIKRSRGQESQAAQPPQHHPGRIHPPP
jgi:hypothetical protein